MKSTWGHIQKSKDGLLYGKPRKTPVRQTPYPQHVNRFNLLPREAAAYVKLRKKGYPINMIASAFGRSTSIVHKIIRANIGRSLRYIDMRKLPSQLRLRCAAVRWNTLQKYIKFWEAWMLGEGDKPP